MRHFEFRLRPNLEASFNGECDEEDFAVFSVCGELGFCSPSLRTQLVIPEIPYDSAPNLLKLPADSIFSAKPWAWQPILKVTYLFIPGAGRRT